MVGHSVVISNDQPIHDGVNIINLQNSNQTGSHWVFLYNGPKQITYIDSFGQPPTIEVCRQITATGKPSVYNTTDLQALTSNSCGFFGTYIAKELARGRPLASIISDFTANPAANEQMLQRYFE